MKYSVPVLFLMFATCVPQLAYAESWAVFRDDTQKCRLKYASSMFARGEIDSENTPNPGLCCHAAGLGEVNDVVLDWDARQ
jgi:hypothetical protein